MRAFPDSGRRPGGRPGERTLRLLLAPLEEFLADPAVTEIVVNRPGEVGVERHGSGWRWHAVPELAFDRLDAIATLGAALSRQDVGPERPLCASVLPDGQRLQVCRPPATAAGTISLTIRQPSAFAPTIDLLAGDGLFARTEAAAERLHPLDAELLALHAARDWARFFPLAVRARKTIIASGDTGSGKTTFARALVQAVPLEERLVTIEDTAEFGEVPHRNRVALFYSKGDQGLARVQAGELVEAALRMRPDRILMQELSDGAAYTFLRGIAAGHPGAITTCHAGSARGAFDALRLMVRQHEAGRHLPDADVRALLCQLVDIVAHCRRDARGFSIEAVWFEPQGSAAMPREAVHG